jgi:hypothetical protein
MGWYLLSAFVVINYTENAFYVAFAALGSWIGAYASITWLVHPLVNDLRSLQ